MSTALPSPACARARAHPPLCALCRPTLEEIRSWGQSFDRLMRSAAGRKVFRDFLRGEYSEENIMFWLACEELKRETDPDAVEEKARFIYEDYISILSPKEVRAAPRPRPRPAPPTPALTAALCAGVAGLARARDRQPQHGGAHAAHVRRGAAADLHAHAPRLVPALRQLAALQDAGAPRRARARARAAAAAAAHRRRHAARAVTTDAATAAGAAPLYCT